MKKIFILVATFIFATSCLDNSTLMDGTENAPNLVGFKNSVANIGFAADNMEHTSSVPIMITGPSFSSVSGDTTVQVEIDPSSTAVADVNFRLDQSQVTLNHANNYVAELPFVVITQNMVAPTSVELILNISTVSNSNILVNSKSEQITININYLCFSGLDNGNPYSCSDVPGGETSVTEIGPGHYSVGAMPFLTAGGNPVSFEFTDTCDVIDINTLVLGSYLMLGQGTVDDGSFTITYILYNGPNVSDGVFFDFSQSPSTYFLQP